MFSPEEASEASIQSKILRSKIFKQNARFAGILLVYYINFLASDVRTVRPPCVLIGGRARPCARGAFVRGERQLLSRVPSPADAIFTAELFTRNFESPGKMYGEMSCFRRRKRAKRAYNPKFCEAKFLSEMPAKRAFCLSII